MALGFWEACGSHVGRRTLRGSGLMSNINGDIVWFYRAHLGIYALCTVGNCTSVSFCENGFFGVFRCFERFLGICYQGHICMICCPMGS